MSPFACIFNLLIILWRAEHSTKAEWVPELLLHQSVLSLTQSFSHANTNTHSRAMTPHLFVPVNIYGDLQDSLMKYLIITHNHSAV